MTYSLLTVEDNADQRAVLEMALSRVGYDVVATSTLDEALDAAGETDFDAVLLDQSLPNGNGLMLMLRLRMLLGEPPYVIMTGDDQILDAAKEAGAFACLLKPFRLSLVEAVIEEALKRHAALRPQRAEEAMPLTTIL